MHRLLRTSAIRLSLRYAIFYLMIAGFGLAAIYWAATSYVSDQVEAALQQQLDSYQSIYDNEGSASITSAVETLTRGFSKQRRHVLLYVDENKAFIAGDLDAWPRKIKANRKVRTIDIDDDDFLKPEAGDIAEGKWPGAAIKFADGSQLLVLQSLRQTHDLREFMLSTIGWTLLLIAGLTIVLAGQMARQMLKRIDQITLTADNILAGDLNQRITTSDNNDEFDDLATRLNAMLDHIDNLVLGMRQVTDNIAHDLRSPLTRLRNRLEVTLKEARKSDAYKETIEASLDDVEDLLKTFNALLDIAQIESGHQRGETQQFNLSELTNELGELYRDVIAEQNQTLTCDIQPNVSMVGNRQLIAQMLSNLLENTMKYAGDGAQVELKVSQSSDGLQIKVADSGPGIPTEKLEEVTKRFVRLESARSSDGNGLGLSLVKAIVSLHKGTMTLSENSPGLKVLVKLPI